MKRRRRQILAVRPTVSRRRKPKKRLNNSSSANRNIADEPVVVIPSSPAQYSSVIVDDGPAGSSDPSTANKSHDAEYTAVATQQPVEEVGQVDAEVDAAGGHHYAPSAIITGKEDSGGAMV